jgi:hypothetical protein
MTSRRFPTPWLADKIAGGYVVWDANGQALAYIYSRDNEAEARLAKMLTKDEARRQPRQYRARLNQRQASYGAPMGHSVYPSPHQERGVAIAAGQVAELCTRPLRRIA